MQPGSFRLSAAGRSVRLGSARGFVFFCFFVFCVLFCSCFILSCSHSQRRSALRTRITMRKSAGFGFGFGARKVRVSSGSQRIQSKKKTKRNTKKHTFWKRCCRRREKTHTCKHKNTHAHRAEWEVMKWGDGAAVGHENQHSVT